MSEPAAPQLSKPAEFPPGLPNAFAFAVFNALSFQMVLSSPMILYAKSLGASATILGIIAGMMPLLVIFQIPAAQYVHRVGYKRFVYAGWGARVICIFTMSAVPLMVFLDATNRLSLMLVLLFAFNLSRGISSCAWLPWITALIPEGIRGKFLSREAGWINLASFTAFIIAAACLGENPQPWQFAMLFVFSGAMGAISLVFLKRIPEVGSPELIKSSTTAVPWKEISRYPPFRKLLDMVVGWSLAYGGVGAFTVTFLKSEAGIPESRILFLTSTAFLGGLSSLFFLGSRLDHLGSKPILAFCSATWVVIMAGWISLAGRTLEVQLGIILTLQFLMGLGAALVSMSITRLAMAVIPVMGRNHFFALYSVAGSLTLGISPMIWGLLIDAIGEAKLNFLGLEWNRYTVFFLGVQLLFVVTVFLTRRLEEPKAASMEALIREILIQSPQRVWVRLWPRG